MDVKKLLSALSASVVAFSLAASPFTSLKACAYDSIQYGIDISEFQTVTDWGAIADSIDYVIMRAGTTLSKNGDDFRVDYSFESHYSGAQNEDLPIGVYYYCGANTLSGFQKNAQETLDILNGRKLDFPVYIDLESSQTQIDLGKSTLTSFALEALNIIEAAGYKAGVYANLDWFTNYLDADRIASEGYEIWLAQYPSGSYAVDPTNYDKSSQCNMWQYSSLGSISGINGNVDVDVYYGKMQALTADEELDIPYPRPDGTDYLKNGSSGKKVSWLQTALNRVTDENLSVDGVFGTATDTAVKTFQTQNRLTADGIVGPDTLSVIVSILKSQMTEALTKPTITTNKEDYFVGDTVELNWAASSSNSNLSHYQLIIDAPDGSFILNETMGLNTSYSFVVSQAGTYTISVFAIPQGSVEDEEIETDQISVQVSYQTKISASETDIILDYAKNESVTIMLTLENVPYGSIVQHEQTNAGTISAKSGTLINGDVPFTITAKFPGENDVTLNVVYNDEILASVTLHIVVIEPENILGDVNGDGEFTIADVVMLQEWLLNGEDLIKWENGDYNADKKITVVDFTLMKRTLLTDFE